MAPRLVRRRPLAERVVGWLNPLDCVLWLSEKLDASNLAYWQKEWANPVGVVLNMVFLVSRANSGADMARKSDDVFGEGMNHVGWLAWVANFIVHMLSLLSFSNAVYTFYRQRHYRLFESSVESIPSTPSAQRVRVASSPLASSPLRFLSKVLTGRNAEARSHPEALNDVWEISVWDPAPISLRIFCLFSPGHVLIYWHFLPVVFSDPKPSITIMKTMLVASLLSIHLLLLQSSFSQQSKDASIIHKEVMNEYDTKYVHPRTRPLMRDVGIQCSRENAAEDEDESVDLYAPSFIINRGFHIRPNPNYVNYTDSKNSTASLQPARGSSTNSVPPCLTPAHLRDTSSPVRSQNTIWQPQLRANGTGDGGSMGVYSHANSPLRKAAFANLKGPRRHRERSLSPRKTEGSPLKRSNLSAISNGQT